jgi:hypothetical protein
LENKSPTEICPRTSEENYNWYPTALQFMDIQLQELLQISEINFKISEMSDNKCM